MTKGLWQKSGKKEGKIFFFPLAGLHTVDIEPTQAKPAWGIRQVGGTLREPVRALAEFARSAARVDSKCSG